MLMYSLCSLASLTMKLTPWLSSSAWSLSLSPSTVPPFHQSKLLLWPHYTPYSHALRLHKQCLISRMPFTASSVLWKNHTPSVCLSLLTEPVCGGSRCFLTCALHYFPSGISDQQMRDNYSQTKQLCILQFFLNSNTIFYVKIALDATG